MGEVTRPLILRPDELPTFDRRGGARTTPLVTGTRGATTFLNGITAFEPGAAIAHHVHNVAESVVILQGDAVADIDGERTRLRPHDTTFVPAGVPHHFENGSATEPMKIMWIYASPEATRTFVDTGQEQRIDAEQPGERPVRLVHEVARILARPGQAEAFERAVAEAAPLFRRARGTRTFMLQRAEEDPLEYRLVVGWESVEDHVDGFRGSPDFDRWRALVADTMSGLPEVAHFRTVLTAF
jgi:quercetin dioxygenase-like cupin family protein/quinol monooxygenase YgiN